MRRLPPSYIANFDSAAAMLRATARFLHGKDFPALGIGAALGPLTPAVNWLPRRPREIFFSVGGWSEGLSASRIHTVRAEDVAEWMVSLYPRRPYPAIAIGSSGGAMVHLYAALGIPWLPQTYLIAVSQTDVHPDDGRHGMEAARHPARILLEHNPELTLHHMHDPNQDRLMLHLMTYFRVKRRSLGHAYERFINEHLEPGGILLLVECKRRWPTTRLGERHVFQFGALGGATPEEFFQGSPRVEDYLARYQSHLRRWDPPEPNGESAEAEWGFEEALREDVERLAAERGYRVVRVEFDEPEHPSPLVADLYRWWYAQRRLHPKRLLIESFILLEPYWALRVGAVPFWMKFNMEASAEWVEQYVQHAGPFDDIRLILFSHGVECVGLPPIERWRALLAQARRVGAFAGVDDTQYPRDFGVFGRYHTALTRLPARYPIPGPLSFGQLSEFLAQQGERYPVRWVGL
jgi:hypothetical protein